MELNEAQLVDVIEISGGDHLVVEFARTGISKRFQKIFLGAIHRTHSPNFVNTAYVESEGDGKFSLIFEAQEYDYSDKLKLRRGVVESFADEAEANDALEKLKALLRVGKAKNNAEGVGDELIEDGSYTRPAKSASWSEVAAMTLLGVCGVALVMGGVGLLLGGLALFHKFYP